MSSYSHQFGAASAPVLVMNPTSAFPFGSSSPPKFHRPAASRKRSRDEAGENLNEEIFGTVRPIAVPRPTLRSCKSQRLDMVATNTTTTSSSPEKVGLFTAPSLPVAATTTISTTTTPVPAADPTLHLGIGWSVVGDATEAMQAAARGWARYIENHYPITHVKLWLESKGLQSYLVEASEGYFLFAENLRHGRLVSTTVEGALANLKTVPPTFEGAEELVAVSSSSSLPRESTPPAAVQQQEDDVEMMAA